MDESRMAGLGLLAEEVDAEAPPTPEEMAARKADEKAQEAQAQQLDEAERQAQQWGVLPFTIGGVLAMAAPELRQVYTEEACLTWGRTMVPVAEKYGFNDAKLLPEAALLASTLGFVVPSVLAIRAAVAEQRAGWMGRVVAWWKRRKARQAEQEGQAHGG